MCTWARAVSAVILWVFFRGRIVFLYILHSLPFFQKVNLAQELETLGVDVIQTEGKFSLDPSK